MPINITIKHNFESAAGRFEQVVHGRLNSATAIWLNNVAFKARVAVQDEMRKVFRNPKLITLNSVLVLKADFNQPMDKQVARVFINDYLAGGVSPAKYLRTEEMGGERAQKRFERGLSTRGLLSGGQEATPGPAAELDGQGQLSGGGITRLLSRVGALSEVGYSGNATRGSFERGIRAQAAKALGKGASREDRRQAAAGAYIPAVRITGTDFFVAKSKLSEGYMGVFRLVGRGDVRPVIWFDTRKPNYSPRFPFRLTVQKAVAAAGASEWKNAVRKASRL